MRTRDLFAGLAVAVHAAFALLVARRIPRKVVVDDGVEMVLEVDAFAQAVGADEHALLGLGQARATRCSRSAGGSVPVTAATSTPLGNWSRSSSATYSAVWMKRQKTMGLKPSLSSDLTRLTSFLSFVVLLAAQALSASWPVPAGGGGPGLLVVLLVLGSAPGVTSMASAESSMAQVEDGLAADFISGLFVSASSTLARLRSVAAAAAGLLARQRKQRQGRPPAHALPETGRPVRVLDPFA